MSWLNLHLQWPPETRDKKSGLSLDLCICAVFVLVNDYKGEMWCVHHLDLTEQDGDANETEDSSKNQASDSQLVVVCTEETW